MKNLLLIALIAVSLASCQQKNYTINGTIKGVLNGKAVLKVIDKDMPVTKDSAVIADGKFTFKGTENEPQLYLIFIDANRVPIVFFGENSDITIDANVNDLGKATVTGSANSDIYKSFIKKMPSKDRMQSIKGEYQKAISSGDKDAIASIRKEVNEIMAEQKAYFIQFVKDNTDNVVGAQMAIQSAREFKLDEFKALVKSFEKNLGKHKYVTTLKKMIEPLEKIDAVKKATEIGAVAPDFSLNNIDGKQVSLSSLKGKYVLVDFWASWCKPCRNENPNVVKAYNKYKAKGFDVLGISLDRDATAWKKAVKDDNLKWNLVIDSSGKTANTYGVQTIPSSFLLDRDGKIIAKNLRGEDLNKKLAELLK